jgi:hypothetical protein
MNVELTATAVADNDQRNFLSEVKRMHSCGTVISKTVDGQSSVSCIADLFANKYRDLYTSIPHDESDMRQVMSELQAQLSISPLAGDCLFSFTEIKEAISKLKRNKKDGSVGLSSDYIINAGMSV